MARTSHYFARGNTARGAHFLYASALRGLDRLFVLSGPPGTGKSTLIRGLADHLAQQGQHVQCFHSPLRPDHLDAVIATDLHVGIIDGRVSEGIPHDEIGSIVTIDLSEAVNRSRLSAEQLTAIEELEPQLAESYSQAYETFLTALRIHDDWERIYIDRMDFAKANEIAESLAAELFEGQQSDSPTRGRHVFFGAATPKGAFDFIQDLTADLERRIFIKGRPGSGKSTLLKKLAAAAEQSGTQVEVFHCGFDPNSLDMLIFPELSTAIFDSTAPHEYFPNRVGDEVLDMYALTLPAGTDEACADAIAPIQARYKEHMQQATAHLATAEAIDAQIKSYYTEVTDFTVVEARGAAIQTELDALLALRGQ